jgi:hypothetical protein
MNCEQNTEYFNVNVSGKYTYCGSVKASTNLNDLRIDVI